MRGLFFLFFFCCGFSVFGQNCKNLKDHPKGEAYAQRLFLYRGFIKNKAYQKALPMWQELYECCKGSSNALFKDGLEIYKHFAKYATDEASKKVYNEKIATIYLDRIECRKDAINRKTNTPLNGLRYYYLGIHYAVELEDYQRAFQAFEQSVAIDDLKTDFKVIKPFAQVTLRLYKNEVIPKEKVIEVREKLLEIASHNLHHPKDSVNYQWMKTEAEALFLKTKTGREIFDCDYFAEEILKDLNEHQGDLEYIIDVLRPKLLEVGCDKNNDIYKKVKEAYVTIAEPGCFPTPKNKRQAEQCLKEGDIECAIENYQKFIYDENQGYGDLSMKSPSAMRLGALYTQKEMWQEALQAYEKAIELNSNTGEPYIKIAFLYMRANRKCDGFERQKVACIAIDYFEKAAKFEDTKEEGIKKAREYSQYLPHHNICTNGFDKPSKKIEAGCVLKKETSLRW